MFHLVIECDGCGEPLGDNDNLDREGLTDLADLRGWRRGGGKHYCPQCDGRLFGRVEAVADDGDDGTQDRWHEDAEEFALRIAEEVDDGR